MTISAIRVMNSATQAQPSHVSEFRTPPRRCFDITSPLDPDATVAAEHRHANGASRGLRPILTELGPKGSDGDQAHVAAVLATQLSGSGAEPVFL